MKEAQITSVDIDKLRDGYRPAAKRGAVLFFILADMAAINAMYQYSLSSYLEVFNYSLKKSLPDSHLPKRLKNIMDTLTHNVYNYACTGKSAHEYICTSIFYQKKSVIHGIVYISKPLSLGYQACIHVHVRTCLCAYY